MDAQELREREERERREVKKKEKERDGLEECDIAEERRAGGKIWGKWI